MVKVADQNNAVLYRNTKESDKPDGCRNRKIFTGQIQSKNSANKRQRDVENDKEYLYKISIAIAEKHYQDEIFHGLLYPSIAMRAEADNVALKPDFVYNELNLERTIFVQVSGKNNKSEYQYSILDSSDNFNDNGKINWKGKPRKWHIDREGSFLVFKVENGKWVARDKEGNVVEPL